jgi:hypothetical protein
MKNHSGCDAQRDGHDSSPSPVRENAKRQKHDASPDSDFDKG